MRGVGCGRVSCGASGRFERSAPGRPNGWVGALRRVGAVVVAVAFVGSLLVSSERAVVAQVVSSVGVSAGVAGILEGDVASFTVTVVAPDGGDYTVAPSAPSAAVTARDDRAEAVVSWVTPRPVTGPGLTVTTTTATIPSLSNGVTYEARVRPIASDGAWLRSNFRGDETTGTPADAVTVPSVGISASATEATEGDSLSFTVRADEPVIADLDVAVVVAENANIDTDGDGTTDAASGVLHATQEGSRTVTIPTGASEVTVTVLTVADDTWENHATVTVTIGAPDDESYTIDATAVAASSHVLDDDVPIGEVSLRFEDPDYVLFDGYSGYVFEGDRRVAVEVTFQTAAAGTPRLLRRRRANLRRHHPV